MGGLPFTSLPHWSHILATPWPIWTDFLLGKNTVFEATSQTDTGKKIGHRDRRNLETMKVLRRANGGSCRFPVFLVLKNRKVTKWT